MRKYIIYGLRILSLLIMLMSAKPGSVVAQEASRKIVAMPDSIRSEHPVLLFFTASWCGPCRMVKGVTFRNAEVAALLDRIDLRVLDIDTPAGKVYQRAYGSERRGVPELVLFDRMGVKIASLEGYNKDPQRTIEFLEQAFPKEEPAAAADVPTVKGRDADTLRVSLPPETYTEAFRSERPGFMLRLATSPWTLNFGGGVLFSGVASSEFDAMRTGFYVSATTSLVMTRRWEAEAGLEFAAMGGKSSSEVLRSYYLVLPAEVQYRITTLLGIRMFLSGGLYGACRVGYAAPDAVVPGRWDAGVRGRLIFEAGSFRLSAVYSRGLVHCLADRGYNQTVGVGVTICLGK